MEPDHSSPQLFPASQPLLLTCFLAPGTPARWGGSCLPSSRDRPRIKAIEARRSSRHAGGRAERRRRKKKKNTRTFSANLRAYGLARGSQLLSRRPAGHAREDTSCSGDSVNFGGGIYIITVTPAPTPQVTSRGYKAAAVWEQQARLAPTGNPASGA